MHPTHSTATGALRAFLILSIVGIAACTSSASVNPSPTAAPSLAAVVPPPSDSATPDVADSAEPSAAASAEATAVPTSIDPCQLISAAEAGQLAGVTFGAGKETTTAGNARICTYGGSTLNVFTVDVAIAPDEATATADEAAAQADLQAAAAKLANKGVTVTQLPGFATGTDAVLMDATVNVSGQTLGVRAMYVLRGTTFFAFSDVALNKAPPSADAMKAEATTVLGRLP